MADNGRWFKLWCASINDPDLANLDIADFGRWAKFGAYLKEHGTEGSVSLTEPSKMICAMLQLPTLKDVVSCLQKVKNVTVSSETNTNVSYFIKYENWHKYQGDFSTNRVKKFRAEKRKNETPKKRREEKREEEIRKEEKRIEKTIITPSGNGDVKAFLSYASETFKDAFKETLLIEYGKDGSIVKNLLKTYDIQKIQALWDAFLLSDDEFIRKAGYSIGIFKTQINKLLSKRSGLAPSKHSAVALNKIAVLRQQKEKEVQNDTQEQL